MRLRFLEAFQKQGEANAVVDRQLLMSPEYAELLLRLHEAARVSSRDHWCAAPIIGPHSVAIVECHFELKRTLAVLHLIF